MTRRAQGPPPMAVRLLEWTAGPGARSDAVIGDLHEEFTRCAERSATRANVWYWVQALLLSCRFAAQAGRSTARPHGRARRARKNGDSTVRTIGIEIRYAFRALVKRPGITALIVLTLALGLGANATIFAMIDALVIHPFPFPNADRIAFVYETAPSSAFKQESVSPANFLDWRKQATAFESLVALDWWDASVVGRDEPESLQGFRVSADFFTTLGVRPILGRGFMPDEEVPGHQRVAVLGQAVWQRRFGGDPGIVGKTVLIDREPYEVIGIAPLGFDFPNGTQVWSPLALTPEQSANRTSHYLSVIGRLRDGRRLTDARAEMSLIGDRLRQQYPEANKDRGIRATTLAQGMLDEGLGPVLSLWQASALFVLLIGCANVASLLLTRGAERHRDIAVRLAMGASRGRIVRELLLESALLGILAVPGAMLAAWVGLQVLRGAMPAKIIRFLPGWNSLTIDVRLLAVTGALALVAAALFGLVPAWQAARPRLVDTLKEGGRSSTSGGGRQRLRRALVVAEITLALPLLVASGMGATGAYRFLNGPQGYDPDGVLSMHTVLPDARYADATARRNFVTAVVDRLRGITGVQIAAAVNIRPSHAGNVRRTIEIEGQPIVDANRRPDADFRAATTGLFDVLRIPLLKGRDFTTADRESTQPVAIVSQSLARRHWPDVDPIGRRLRVGSGPWLTVIGVSGDVVQDWFVSRDYPTLYVPYLQNPTGNVAVVLRATGDPAALASQARAAVRAVDTAQPVFDVMTMREALKERTVGLRFIGGVMAVFGGLALLLAIVGIYSVMAYFVTQRTHEIGVRMALGATPGDVLRLTVSQTGRLTIIGVVLGIVMSILLARLIEAGLIGSASSDGRMIACVAVLLALAALAAGYIPARRAAGIDPIAALRE
jgi:putative ABC transport system permease protein